MRHTDKLNEWLRPSKLNLRQPIIQFSTFFLTNGRKQKLRWGMDLICILYARTLRHHVEFARYELAGMKGCANYSVISGSSQVSLTTRQLATHPLHFSAIYLRFQFPSRHNHRQPQASSFRAA